MNNATVPLRCADRCCFDSYSFNSTQFMSQFVRGDPRQD